MKNNDWISSLKAGDNVVVHFWSWSDKSYKQSVVEKVTPKGFVKVNGILYNSIDGRARGDFRSCLLNPEDDETKKKVMLYQKEAFARGVLKKMWDIRGITFEQAVKINEILNGVNNNASD